MKTLSWNPVRKDEIYCSPACGANCTHEEYEIAHKQADALIKKCEREIGGRWEKRVHENLGWHYSVTLKDAGITISPNYLSAKYGEKWYSVASDIGGTPIEVSVRKRSRSIKKLFDLQMAEIKTQYDYWKNKVEKINIATNL